MLPKRDFLVCLGFFIGLIVCAKAECGEDEFTCRSGYPACIERRRVNDTRIDCQDGSDEGCPERSFVCWDRSACINLERFQDGVADCLDKSDEECLPLQHRCLCGWPRCVDTELVGDGVKDCEDGSDEKPVDEDFVCPEGNDVALNVDFVRTKRRAADVSTRVDGPVTTSMFTGEDATRIRPTGLLTSTVGTFINEGTTTEYATKVYGTYVEGQYAKIVSTSSRVFFEVPTVGGSDALGQIRPTGLISSITATRVNGFATTIHTTEYYRTYIDGTYAQLVSSYSNVHYPPWHTDPIIASDVGTKNFSPVQSGHIYQTAINVLAPPTFSEKSVINVSPVKKKPVGDVFATKVSETEETADGVLEEVRGTFRPINELASVVVGLDLVDNKLAPASDQVVTVTGTHGAFVNTADQGRETTYNVFTGTYVKDAKTYLFYFGNSALNTINPTSVNYVRSTQIPDQGDQELIVEEGGEGRIVVNVGKQVNILVPKQRTPSKGGDLDMITGAAEIDGSKMGGVFIEGSEDTSGFSVNGALRSRPNVATEMLTVTIGRGLAQTKVIRDTVNPTSVRSSSDRTLYRFFNRNSSLRDRYRLSYSTQSVGGRISQTNRGEEREDIENLLKARRVELPKRMAPSEGFRPSRVQRPALPTFTVGQDYNQDKGKEDNVEVVVNVERNVESYVGNTPTFQPRKNFRFISTGRSRVGKAFRGFQIINDKEDLQEGASEMATVTYLGFADFTTTIGNTVVVFMPRTKAGAEFRAHTRQTFSPQQVRPTSSIFPVLATTKPDFESNRVVTSIKTFFSHTPGMVTRTVPGHSLTMEKSIATVVASHGVRKDKAGDFDDSDEIEPSDGVMEIVGSQTIMKDFVNVKSKVLLQQEGLETIVYEPVQLISPADVTSPKPVPNTGRPDIHEEVVRVQSNVESSTQSNEDTDAEKIRPTQPLSFAKTETQVYNSVDRFPTGLVKSIGGTQAFNGTTTLFTSLIYGTYINGNYAQIIHTTSSIFFVADKTRDPLGSGKIKPTAASSILLNTKTTDNAADTTTTTERDSTSTTTSSNEQETTTEGKTTTVSQETTTESELLNEVETGRKINSRPGEQVIVPGDGKVVNKEFIKSQKDEVTTLSGFVTRIFPSTVYKTYTYFTTFFIPDGSGTSTSIKTRDVTTSEVNYVTSIYRGHLQGSEHDSIEPTPTLSLDSPRETALYDDDQTTTTEQSTPKLPEAVTAPITTPTPVQEGIENEEGDVEEGEEIELIFKTLYTTYTYLTTYFQGSKSSILSREVVVTNTITSTQERLATEPAVAGLFQREDSLVESHFPSSEIFESETPPTSVGVGRPTTKYFSDLDEVELEATPTYARSDIIDDFATTVLKTFYTTYTYFTSIFVDGKTMVSSRTEVYTNVVTPSGYIVPASILEEIASSGVLIESSTIEPSNDILSSPTAGLETTLSTTYTHKTTATRNGTPKVERSLEIYTNVISADKTVRSGVLRTIKPTASVKSPIASRDIIGVDNVALRLVGTTPQDSNGRSSEISEVTTEASTSEVTTETTTERNRISDRNNNFIEDQELSESNTDIDPSPTLVLQTSYTTFTYYTTVYRGTTSEIISRLETETNIVTETLKPENTKELASTLDASSVFPITYFTTFTYWTTFYKDGNTVVTSREETVSNVVTPGVDEVEPTTIQVTPTEALRTVTVQPTPEPQLTTYYTTYTYFTTSYIGDSTVVNSRLETVTNVVSGSLTPTLEDNEIQTARAIGNVPASEQAVIDKSIVPGKGSTVLPTGLLSTIVTSEVNDGTTTLFSTDVYGSYIDGYYAKVLESSTEIITPTTVEVPTASSQKTGVISINEGSIVDAEGLTTTYFTSKAIGTYIGNLYAQVEESTSSVHINPDKTAEPSSTTSLKTGLVRLVEGSIVQDEATTFYESKIIGTIISGRYAQIIESTSSFKITPTSTLSGATVIPTSATDPITTAPPVLEGSISEKPDDDHRDGDDEEEEDDEEGPSAGRGRVTSRLSFSTRRRSFTPVIRPFASRNRPTFFPRRRPTSATIITRTSLTPTVTATPANSGEGTFTRNRYNNRRGGSTHEVRATSSRRFRGRGSSTVGSLSQSSSPGGFYSSTAGRRSSSGRVSPTASSNYQGSSRRGGNFNFRSSYVGGGRGSSEHPFGRSSVGVAASSRHRIRPTSTLRGVLPTTQSPDVEDNTVDAEESETEQDESQVTEGTESPKETTTESHFRRPLRFRRPLPTRAPTSTPRAQTTAPRRASFRRTFAGRNSVDSDSQSSATNEERADNRRGPTRYRASSSATTTSTTTTRPRLSRPNRLLVLNRPRPTGGLFPPRALFRRPSEEKEEEPEEENLQEEKSDETVDGTNDDIQEGEEEEEIEDAEYEASEHVAKQVSSDAKKPTSLAAKQAQERKSQLLNIASRLRRSKRQVEYGSRSSLATSRGLTRYRRPTTSRRTFTPEKVREEEDETTYQAPAPSKPSTARYNPRTRSQPRVRPTPTTPRTQFTLTNKDSSFRSNFRRPPTSRRKPDSTTERIVTRPKAPRLRSHVTEAPPRSSTRRYSTSQRRNPSRSRYRPEYDTSDYETYSQPSFDGTITVTHKIPTEVTIPIVNGKNTEYKQVLTASPSIEVLRPDQYTATEIGGNSVILASEVTNTGSPGVTEVTQFIIRETPTTSVTFTPTIIRGRRTSFSHIIPSTVYEVERVVSTIQDPLSSNAPLANILLSQLLLGNFGIQPNFNPLLGLNNPVTPATPTTEFKTKATTYVTTVTDFTSTVLPVTLRGKEILTTVVDSSVDVITATEYITETVVVTPTQNVGNQLNSLLLPALLQAQLLGQTPQQPNPLLPLQQAQLLQQQALLGQTIPNTEEPRRRPNGRRRRPHKNSEEEDEGIRPSRESESEFDIITREEINESPARGKNTISRKNKGKHSQSKEPDPPKPVETSVVTLYVSGRRPGEFSTVLSTVILDGNEGSTVVKREIITPVDEKVKPSKIPAESNENYSNEKFQDLDYYLMPAINEIEGSMFSSGVLETQSLESIVGDVSKYVELSSDSDSKSLASVSDKTSASSSSTSSQAGHFLSKGPAELAPLTRKVRSPSRGLLSIDDEEGVDDNNDETASEQSSPATAPKRRQVRVRVPVNREKQREQSTQDGARKRTVVVKRIPIRTQNLADVESSDHQELLTLSEARNSGYKVHEEADGEREHDERTKQQQQPENIATVDNFGRRRVKVIRQRPKTQGNPDNIVSDNAQKRRIVITRRRRPQESLQTSTPFDEEANTETLARQPTFETNLEQADEPAVNTKPHGSGTSRRRVVITRKRPVSSSAVVDSPSPTRQRHRIVITKKRPIPPNKKTILADSASQIPSEGTVYSVFSYLYTILGTPGEPITSSKIVTVSQPVRSKDIALPTDFVQTKNSDGLYTLEDSQSTVYLGQRVNEGITTEINLASKKLFEFGEKYVSILSSKPDTEVKPTQEAQKSVYKDETESFPGIEPSFSQEVEPESSTHSDVATETLPHHSPSSTAPRRRGSVRFSLVRDGATKRYSAISREKSLHSESTTVPLIETDIPVEETESASSKPHEDSEDDQDVVEHEDEGEERTEEDEDQIQHEDESIHETENEDREEGEVQEHEENDLQEEKDEERESEIQNDRETEDKHEEDITSSTFDGPRYVRPTRFSITRKASEEFLNRLQSLRTNANIVFPSRRGSSSSRTRTPFHSRLSRTRKPKVMSTTPLPSATVVLKSFTTTTTLPIHGGKDFITLTVLTSSLTSLAKSDLYLLTASPQLFAPITPTPTVHATSTPTFGTGFLDSSEDTDTTSIPSSSSVQSTPELKFTTLTLTETQEKTFTYVITRVSGEDKHVTTTVEVKPVTSTILLTQLITPLSAPSVAFATLGVSDGSKDEGLRGQQYSTIGRENAARYNLATKIMSNGVEVIVAGDRTTLPGEEILRVLSTASRPITLAPSTLSDHMMMKLPSNERESAQVNLLSSLQSHTAQFITKTYLTTFTYLTTYLHNDRTIMSSREEVISNIVTEELKRTKVQPTPTMTSGFTFTTGYDNPSYETNTYFTTYTYLNTLLDGEVPVVVTSKETVSNTVTAPVSENIPSTDFLQPSEPSYQTNTYFNTFTFTKTLSEGNDVKVVSTKDVVTQVVITEAPVIDKTPTFPAPSSPLQAQQIRPTSTTEILKTYFVTYTYYTTTTKGTSTIVKSNIATSSEVVTEKFYLSPKKTPNIEPTSSQLVVPTAQRTTEHHGDDLPVHVYATKTYLTTYTYFTTLLEGTKTITTSRINVSSNIVTEAITTGLDAVYLDSLKSSFLAQKSDTPLVTTVMLGGEELAITAMHPTKTATAPPPTTIPSLPTVEDDVEDLQADEPKDEDVVELTTSRGVSSSTPSSESVITGSTIIFFDDLDQNSLTPTASLQHVNSQVLPSEVITGVTTVFFPHQPETEQGGETTANHEINTDTPEFLLSSLSSSTIPSYLTSTISASTVIANDNGVKTTLVPGDAVIVLTRPDGNITMIPVSDPASKKPESAIKNPNSDIAVSDILSLGSLGINGLNALGPMINAMAGLIQSNLQGGEGRPELRRNDTTPFYPLTTTPSPRPVYTPPQPVHVPQREPVYIPVGGLASSVKKSDNLEEILSDDPNAKLRINQDDNTWLKNQAYSTIDQEPAAVEFPDTDDRRPLLDRPSHLVVGRPTHETPLLQDGIPIQPGQVITAHSDVIVGKPAILGPRPRPGQSFPQAPTDFPSSVGPEVLHNHVPPHIPLHAPPKPGSDVPIGMRPPPPPQPSPKDHFSAVNFGPTRVSVISGVQTVFLGNPPVHHAHGPGPVHMVPLKPGGRPLPHHPIPTPLHHHHHHQTRPAPHPVFIPGQNVIDRSTGQIKPSRPTVIHGATTQFFDSNGRPVRDQSRPSLDPDPSPFPLPENEPPNFVGVPDNHHGPGQEGDDRPYANGNVPNGGRPPRPLSQVGPSRFPHPPTQPSPNGGNRRPQKPHFHPPLHPDFLSAPPGHLVPRPFRPENIPGPLIIPLNPDSLKGPTSTDFIHRPHGSTINGITSEGSDVGDEVREESNHRPLKPGESPSDTTEETSASSPGPSVVKKPGVELSLEPGTFKEGDTFELEAQANTPRPAYPFQPPRLPQSSASHHPGDFERYPQSHLPRPFGTGFPPRSPITPGQRVPVLEVNLQDSTHRPITSKPPTRPGKPLRIRPDHPYKFELPEFPVPTGQGRPQQRPGGEFERPAPTGTSPSGPQIPDEDVSNEEPASQPSNQGKPTGSRRPDFVSDAHSRPRPRPSHFDGEGHPKPFAGNSRPPRPRPSGPGPLPRPSNLTQNIPFNQRPSGNGHVPELRPPHRPPVRFPPNRPLPSRIRPGSLPTGPPRKPIRPPPEFVLESPEPPTNPPEVTHSNKHPTPSLSEDASVYPQDVQIIASIEGDNKIVRTNFISGDRTVIVDPTQSISPTKTQRPSSYSSTRQPVRRPSVRPSLRPSSSTRTPVLESSIASASETQFRGGSRTPAVHVTKATDVRKSSILSGATTIFGGLFTRPSQRPSPSSNFYDDLEEESNEHDITNIVGGDTPTKYVTHTQTMTQTVTHTDSTVVYSLGQPVTKTVVLTETVAPKTIISTIIGTVTEIHTLEPSTMTATVTTTATATVSATVTMKPPPSQPPRRGNHGIGEALPEISVAASFPTFAAKPSDPSRKQGSKGRQPEADQEEANKGIELENEVNRVVESGPGDRPLSVEQPELVGRCQPVCSAARNEICQEVDGNFRCICRPGFARMFPDRPCKPTYTYEMRLLLDRIKKDKLRFIKSLNDRDSREFRRLAGISREGLDRAVMRSDLRDIFHGVTVTGFEPPTQHELRPTRDGIMVNFFVQLSDNMDEKSLEEVFRKSLRTTNYSLGGTDIYASREVDHLDARDFDECSEPDFHDCSDHAHCFNLRGTYTCSCKEGFADLSENAFFPGRVCSAELIGCDKCNFHGTCYSREDGEILCDCFQWYTGDNCQINLKVLLIALVTVGAVLLVMLFVCVILACAKKKKPKKGHAAAPGFLKYRGAGHMRGTLDKTAMIQDTSSESSCDQSPLPYMAPMQQPSGTFNSKMKKLKGDESGGDGTLHSFMDQDRSLTVMIPRAKYRPVQPASSLVSMSTFSVEDRHGASQEQKLINYLESGSQENRNTSRRKQSNSTNPDQPSSRKSSGARKQSTGALVSAGFEVSATVGKSLQKSNDSHTAQIHTGTTGSRFATARAGDSAKEEEAPVENVTEHSVKVQDLTVSEARSYDETLVHPPTKCLQPGTSMYGSKPSSHGLHNDEAHTMAERDVGSTFLMPQTQLYKPARGSDISNFDSL